VCRGKTVSGIGDHLVDRTSRVALHEILRGQVLRMTNSGFREWEYPDLRYL